MHLYSVFGLRVASEFPLPAPQKETDGNPDVYIRSGGVDPVEGLIRNEKHIRFFAADTGRFQIENGREIVADLEQGASEALVSLYLLGSCMGAILYQRGGMLLHGSCVAKDGRGLLLTGDSGAGKSTLAREFLQNGWQLVTDDVASIVLRDGVYYVQSSYPSQKLWQDAMERYTLDGESLFQENRKDKFHVDAQAFFKEGLTPLKMVVRLAVGEQTGIQTVEGIAQVHQLMKNTYRPYMILPQLQEKHFQRCVDLADEVPMLLGVRTNAPNGSQLLCEKIQEAFL